MSVFIQNCMISCTMHAYIFSNDDFNVWWYFLTCFVFLKKNMCIFLWYTLHTCIGRQSDWKKICWSHKAASPPIDLLATYRQYVISNNTYYNTRPFLVPRTFDEFKYFGSISDPPWVLQKWRGAGLQKPHRAGPIPDPALQQIQYR